ncbi:MULTISPECIES: hypothetical protein [Clostridium]|jgi:hypothetical protein|uniref:hypothetical protein n=1 Tax=Clostridium TaxID=1485 RepID=UPI000E993A00|nr:hypothetical protein [Clostridium tyrobutyricum]HBG38938.1 hypothetical protein [Clostridiaceae bacterium]
MDDIMIMQDANGGTAVLTTDSPLSHYGIPVLRIEADDINGDFAPADLIGSPPIIITAASVIAGWADNPERTPEEIAAARKYLSQWPEGPQIK